MSNKKERILHVTHDMGVGGAEQVIRHLIFALHGDEYDAEIACIDGVIGQMGTTLQDSNISVKAIERGAGLDKQTIKELRQHIKIGKFTIVHCHQYTPFCYGALASIGLGVNVIFTEHGRFFPDRYTWKRRIVNQILYRLANHIVAISESTKQALHDYEWIPKRRVTVIYNGIEKPVSQQSSVTLRSQLGINEDSIVLGTISRLDSIKNQKMMIEALQCLRITHPYCVLILAGDGPERESLETLVAQLELSDFVLFTGFVTDIAAYLELIDIFLLTSFSEGASMTLLEAMALSKPIVATAVGGNVELIGCTDCGILIDSNDVDALTQSLQSLCSNEALRIQSGAKANATFQSRFTRYAMVEQYKKLYVSY